MRREFEEQGIAMNKLRWGRLFHNVLQKIVSSRKKTLPFALPRFRAHARNSARSLGSSSVEINSLESLEPRMLLSGSSTSEEPVLHVMPVATEPAQGSPTSLAGLTVNAPLSDTFSLNSNASAKQTIYLDFTGNVTSGTYWNYGKSANLVTNVFSLDNDTAFSDTELQRIQNIWQRVAEDFIAFDVNVTTAEPPQSDLIKSGFSDDRWGIRVAIGGRYQDWYGSSAGGVAYLNSFNWSTDTPTFVFSETLYNNEKYVAEAISHEVGHTLNLSHDGTSTLGYYTGHGNGATGWAPIMGVGYYRELTQWSKGEYSGASQTQDDLSIITTNNGFGYRADDYGNSLNNATALTLAQNSTITNQEGIIEQNTDTDWFSFTTTGGTINLSIDPFVLSPNLDILAELYNEAGQLILSSNPATLLDATLTTTLAAGTYYVKIDGIGKGNPTTGYSDYGSLGQYTISGTIEGLPGSAGPMSFGAWNSSSGLLFSDTSNMSSTTAPAAPSYGPNGQGEAFTGDFDGDNVDELAVRDAAGNWWIGENVSGSFQFTKWGKWGSVSLIQNTLVGDFNGDGKDDIAGLYSNGSWWIAVSSGSGFTNQRWASWGSPGSIQNTYVGDFNGDGKDDIAGMYTSGSWWIGVSQGNVFSNQRWARWSSAAMQQAVVADFDNDGRDDIAALYSNGSWWVGTSSGTNFVAQRWTTWGSVSQIQVIKTGDFNGDGKADIAGMWQSGSWWVATSGGSGFTNQGWTQWGSTQYLKQVLVGDFSGDGKDDLIGMYSSGWWWMAQSQGNSFQNSALTQWGNGSLANSYFVGNFNTATAAALPGEVPANTATSSVQQSGPVAAGLFIEVSFEQIKAFQPSATSTEDTQFLDLVNRWSSEQYQYTDSQTDPKEESVPKRKTVTGSEKEQPLQVNSEQLLEFLNMMNQQMLDHSLYQLG